MTSVSVVSTGICRALKPLPESRSETLRAAQTDYRYRAYMAAMRCVGDLEAWLCIRGTTGIAMSTKTGERYPMSWMSKIDKGQRLLAKDFESIVHNSAAGFISATLGWRGPQLVTVHGDIIRMAELAILSDQASAIVVVEHELGLDARAMLLCADTELAVYNRAGYDIVAGRTFDEIWDWIAAAERTVNEHGA